MNSQPGYDEVKRRILSAIFAAEDAGFDETAEELKVLLRHTLKHNDIGTNETTGTVSFGT
jgi:hypothetical protein